jgi:AcrR family transcriptional regulator
MCPAPARTTGAAIVAAARKLLERDGAAGVTMQAVGAAVGVRSSSLYKHFADRAALLQAVEAEALAQLAALLHAAADAAPRSALERMAAAYRSFAQASPAVYALLFSPCVPDQVRLAARAEAAAPVQVVMTRLIGPSAALPAARLLTAFLHGWVCMEQAGVFPAGSTLEAAFTYALAATLNGIEAGQAPLRL